MAQEFNLKPNEVEQLEPPMSDSNDVAAVSSSSFSDSSSFETPDTPSLRGITALQLQPFINFEEIDLQEKVGHGSYGVVYKAQWRDRYVAVKEFGPCAEQKAIEIEVKQLSRVQHRNIISLFGHSNSDLSTYLIMEYAEGGSLHNFLHGKVKPYYSTAHAISWAYQCAEGVAYLHAMKPKPLIHRDLKPLNLLLTDKGRHLKICDFGTVVDKSTFMTNNKGSAAWMAPEVFEGSKYTEKCDIFSWAIVLWEVLSRQQPFKEIDNTYSIMWKIHKGDRPPMIQNCPEKIQNLMTSCWATIPDSRPSMEYIVKVMEELVSLFPGAEEPLEYEFVNQQIVRTDSRSDTLLNYSLDFSSLATSSSDNQTEFTQITPTNSNSQSNSSDTPTPTNVAVSPDFLNKPQVAAPSITASTTRWDVIPEESDTTFYNKVKDEADFNLTPSSEIEKRNTTIRNGMMQMASVPMAPLNVDVDPNAWDLNGNENALKSAKEDGKSHLTVSDTKPIISMPANNTTVTGGGNNAVISSHPINDDDLDEDDSDGTDQSLYQMLDPELQPEPPIPNNNESQSIHREHLRLVKEYLKVDTNLYYAEDFKEKYLLQMDPDERQQKLEILKKINEKNELMELFNNLKQQVEKIQYQQNVEAGPSSAVPVSSPMQRQTNSTEVVADDGWVVISPSSNQNT